MTVAEVLERAANLIEPEGAWTQDWFARDVIGREVEAIDPHANCWCVRGAVFAVCGSDSVDEEAIFNPLHDLLGFELMSVEEWNDDPDRTQTEVVAKLREAAALAREQGK